MNPVTIRRTLGGVALIVAPLLNCIAALLEKLSTETSAADTLNTVAAHTTRETLSAISDAFGTFFFIGVALTFLHFLTPRAPRWAHITTAMMLIGTIGFGGMHAFDLIQVEMAKSADRDAMIALWDKLQDSALIVFPLMFVLGLVLGLVAMTIGLFKTRSMPRQLLPLLWVFVIWDVGLGIAGVDVQIANVIDPHELLVIALGTLGVLVLRMPDEAWARGDPLTLPSATPAREPVPA